MQALVISLNTVANVGRESALTGSNGRMKEDWDMRKEAIFVKRSDIEWCDYTWNPITGCRHNCEYCYAQRMVGRFAGDIRLNKMAREDYSLVPAADGSEDIYVLDAPMLNETGSPLLYPFGFWPTYHRYRIEDSVPVKLKMGSNIFVGAMADIFGDWIPGRWIDDIFSVCMQYPVHNYLFLTKNPDRYIDFGVPMRLANLWYGTTVTSDSDIYRVASLLMMNAKTFVSIEPLKERIGKDNIESICGAADWIIIGAETGRNKYKVVPDADWIEDIVVVADRAGKPVFMKNSLIPIIGEDNMRRDFPEQLRYSRVSPKMEKKLYDFCARCKGREKKSDMITLLAKSRRGEQPKQFGFMCPECFMRFCVEMGLDIPRLKELEDSFTEDLDDRESIKRGNNAVKLEEI